MSHFLSETKINSIDSEEPRIYKASDSEIIQGIRLRGGGPFTYRPGIPKALCILNAKTEQNW